MRYGYSIGGKEYSFQTEKKGRMYVCKCVEYPQAIGNGPTEKAAMEACINAVSQLLGQTRVKVVKKVKRRWVPKPVDATKKKKPWWCFW